MDFRSILWETGPPDEPAAMPDYFPDLHLDQIVEAVVADYSEYHLDSFFYDRLTSVDAVMYRQEVFRDLEDPLLFQVFTAFAAALRQMRHYLDRAQKAHYKLEGHGWLLDAVAVYCAAVDTVAGELAAHRLESRGLRAFRDYLDDYVGSVGYKELSEETRRVRQGLTDLRYSVQIRANRVTVRRYEEEPDYSEQVLQTFERFEQGAVKDYRVRFRETVELDHVEAAILDRVALLFPGEFSALEQYCLRQRSYLDPTVATFDREVQFYLAYLAHLAKLKPMGLAFCYPEVSAKSKAVRAAETFDLALATKLAASQGLVVTNDFRLGGPERVFVVSGPNQGGKTTFSRTFGQIHHLASIGCPLPGVESRLFLFDQLFTHFEREEDIAALTGKLEDDLIRIKSALSQATSNSIVIMNEIFTSTTLHDAWFLGRKVLERIGELDVLGVYVTFVEELASLSRATVSMVSTTEPDDPTKRTYKVVRKPADGLAFAVAIAQRYRLTYDQLKRRIGS